MDLRAIENNRLLILSAIAIIAVSSLVYYMVTLNIRNKELEIIEVKLSDQIIIAKSQLSEIQNMINALEDLSEDCTKVKEDLKQLELLVSALQKTLDLMEVLIEEL